MIVQKHWQTKQVLTLKLLFLAVISQVLFDRHQLASVRNILIVYGMSKEFLTGLFPFLFGLLFQRLLNV